MDARELKTYVYENNYVEQILEAVGCHHIVYHSIGGYWTACNPDGDNKRAIILYNDEMLICLNKTRQMVNGNRTTDIIDLVSFICKLPFPKALNKICEEIGLDYYHNFDDDIPESFKVLDLIENMSSGIIEEKEKPLKPISEKILTYYCNYVNQIFADDYIDYETQKEFEIGYDQETNRYTIPIRSEVGDLVGVKGRYYERNVPDGENKYTYLEPCPKSRILYGLYKTLPYIQQKNQVFLFESEKAVLQCWSYGYQNCVASGGKELSQHQIDMLVRLGTNIVIAFDKDVQKDELECIAERFPEGVPVYCIYDKNSILEQKESPSDNPIKWNQLVKNNIYRIR